MAGHRSERVSERIHQEVSMLFDRAISDPRLAFVNVTRVDVTGDLRLAKIYIAPSAGDVDDDQVLEGLARATGYVRRHLAATLDLHFTPEVRFYLDQSIVKGEHFLEVLERVKQEEHERAAPPPPPKVTRRRKKT